MSVWDMFEEIMSQTLNFTRDRNHHKRSCQDPGQTNVFTQKICLSMNFQKKNQNSKRSEKDISNEP